MSREDRYSQVLALAEEMFAREGFHHVSMDDIAERAEVSKPVLYRHFPSKLDLYLAVVDRRGEALVAAVEAELADPDGDRTGPEVAHGVVTAFVTFVEQAGQTSSLLFASDVTRDDAVRARVESASHRAAATIRRSLATITGLPDHEAGLLAEVLVAMAQATATSRTRGTAVDTATAVDLVSRLAWSGVRGFVPDEEQDPRQPT